MSYNPVMQGDQIYYQDPRAFAQNQRDYELRSLTPSYTSAKGGFVSHGTPVLEDTTSAHQHLLQGPSQHAHGAKWTPGLWKQFPVLAILSILGILASTVASITVLLRSHHQAIDDWGYGVAPSVYLAIASVIANALTAYALAVGLEIAFWRNALRGRTLAGLNQNWLNGNSIYHALLHGYRTGGRITALACIFSVLALLRGPLNQKASAVQSDVKYTTAGTLQLHVAQRLPEGYTGISLDSRAQIAEVARLMPDFAQVMQDYSSRANISMAHANCGERCTASVKGFGFKTSCYTKDFASERPTNNAFNQTIFETSTSLYPIGKKPEGQTWYEDVGMRFNVTYRVSRESGGGNTTGSGLTMITNMRSHICNLTGSTVEYQVHLDPQTISLESNRSSDRFLQDQTMPGPGTNHHSTISGFEYAAKYLFTSKATFIFVGAKSAITMSGSLANEMVRGPITGWNETFEDPMDDMLDKCREIAFRTAIRAGKDLPDNVTSAEQDIAYQGSASRSIYITDFRYMLAAAILSVASVLAISLPFYGWWQLGRTVSLSPLEIAKAFDAPIMAQVGSNVDLSDTSRLGVVAGMNVQYGVRVDEQAYSTQYNGGYMEGQRRRLVMGYAGYVGRPNKGDVFGN